MHGSLLLALTGALGVPTRPPYVLSEERTVLSAMICLSNCSGHGVCSSSGCSCLDGYGGVDCSIAPTVECDCSGHGWCVRSVCLCEEHWTGASCDVPSACPNGCSGYGHCYHGRCQCDKLHWGDDCSKPSPTCPGACGGIEHGVCHMNSISGLSECKCRPEWRGDECEISTAPVPVPCPSANCSSHGACDTRNGACVCAEGWTGLACERSSGSFTTQEVLVITFCCLLFAAAALIGGLVLYCVRARGARVSDVLLGRWHVRKEEGWRQQEADGQMPDARFEAFGFWLPGQQQYQ